MSQIHDQLLDGWTLHEQDQVTSTNLIAADLPPWHAVRADTQSQGRGRFQRSWVSDAGGLWLSAVVPINSNSPAWLALPLAAGVAVADAIESLGVEYIRMRWPNDLLVVDRKIAGLLIDHFRPGQAVVGIGINVQNDPVAQNPSLANQITRLADLIPAPPSLAHLCGLILFNLKNAIAALQSSGIESFVPRLKHLWGRPRSVELDLDGTLQRGMFMGVDQQGRLVLADETGATASYSPQQVRHLKEVGVS